MDNYINLLVKAIGIHRLYFFFARVSVKLEIYMPQSGIMCLKKAFF